LRSRLLLVGTTGLAVGLAIDLDMHPRLGLGLAGDLLWRRGVADLVQVAHDIAPHDELRVDDKVHGMAVSAHLGGDRVDEEGHVVDDDLNDCVTVRRPAVPLGGGGEHLHPRRPLRPAPGQLPVRQRGTGDVDGVAPCQVVRGDVAVVAPQERPKMLGLVVVASRHGSHLGGAVEKVCLLAFHRVVPHCFRQPPPVPSDPTHRWERSSQSSGK